MRSAFTTALERLSAHITAITLPNGHFYWDITTDHITQIRILLERPYTVDSHTTTALMLFIHKLAHQYQEMHAPLPIPFETLHNTNALFAAILHLWHQLDDASQAVIWTTYPTCFQPPQLYGLLTCYCDEPFYETLLCYSLEHPFKNTFTPLFFFLDLQLYPATQQAVRTWYAKQEPTARINQLLHQHFKTTTLPMDQEAWRCIDALLGLPTTEPFIPNEYFILPHSFLTKWIPQRVALWRRNNLPPFCNDYSLTPTLLQDIYTRLLQLPALSDWHTQHVLINKLQDYVTTHPEDPYVFYVTQQLVYQMRTHIYWLNDTERKTLFSLLIQSTAQHPLTQLVPPETEHLYSTQCARYIALTHLFKPEDLRGDPLQTLYLNLLLAAARHCPQALARYLTLPQYENIDSHPDAQKTLLTALTLIQQHPHLQSLELMRLFHYLFMTEFREKERAFAWTWKYGSQWKALNKLFEATGEPVITSWNPNPNLTALLHLIPTWKAYQKILHTLQQKAHLHIITLAPHSTIPPLPTLSVEPEIHTPAWNRLQTHTGHSTSAAAYLTHAQSPLFNPPLHNVADQFYMITPHTPEHVQPYPFTYYRIETTHIEHIQTLTPSQLEDAHAIHTFHEMMQKIASNLSTQTRQALTYFCHDVTPLYACTLALLDSCLTLWSQLNSETQCAVWKTWQQAEYHGLFDLTQHPLLRALQTQIHKPFHPTLIYHTITQNPETLLTTLITLRTESDVGHAILSLLYQIYKEDCQAYGMAHCLLQVPFTMRTHYEEWITCLMDTQHDVFFIPRPDLIEYLLLSPMTLTKWAAIQIPVLAKRNERLLEQAPLKLTHALLMTFYEECATLPMVPENNLSYLTAINACMPALISYATKHPEDPYLFYIAAQIARQIIHWPIAVHSELAWHARNWSAFCKWVATHYSVHPIPNDPPPHRFLSTMERNAIRKAWHEALITVTRMYAVNMQHAPTQTMMLRVFKAAAHWFPETPSSVLLPFPALQITDCIRWMHIIKQQQAPLSQEELHVLHHTLLSTYITAGYTPASAEDGNLFTLVCEEKIRETTWRPEPTQFKQLTQAEIPLFVTAWDLYQDLYRIPEIRNQAHDTWNRAIQNQISQYHQQIASMATNITVDPTLLLQTIRLWIPELQDAKYNTNLVRWLNNQPPQCVDLTDCRTLLLPLLHHLQHFNAQDQLSVLTFVRLWITTHLRCFQERTYHIPNTSITVTDHSAHGQILKKLRAAVTAGTPIYDSIQAGYLHYQRLQKHLTDPHAACLEIRPGSFLHQYFTQCDPAFLATWSAYQAAYHAFSPHPTIMTEDIAEDTTSVASTTLHQPTIETSWTSQILSRTRAFFQHESTPQTTATTQECELQPLVSDHQHEHTY